MIYQPIYTTAIRLPAIPGYDLTCLSGIVDFGHDAMVKFDSAPGCKVDMFIWHDKGDDTCFACMGGSAALLMAGIGGPDDSFWEGLDPDNLIAVRTAIAGRANIDLGVVEVLERTLNNVRMGLIASAFDNLGMRRDSLNWIASHRRTRAMPDYNRAPEPFRDALWQLARDLRELGY